MENSSWRKSCANTDDYYRIENWYPDIQDLTFDTVTMPLSLSEAKMLKKYKELSKYFMIYEDLQSSENNPDFHVGGSEWDSEGYSKVEHKLEDQFDEREKLILDQLRGKLDALIQPFVERSGGAFVKLSTRSPKDAAIFSEKMKQMLTSSVQNSKADPASEEAKIEDVIAYTRALSLCLRVSSGQEAIQLLLRSQRTYNDISFAELMNQNEKDFNMQIIVREWSNHLHPEWEFRAFVFNSQLTTCTQYISCCFVPQIWEKRQQIQEKIIQLWESMKHRVRVADYTLDLALSPDLSQIWIVELNPPPPSAGQGLFDWHNEADQKIIKEGPFELRVLDKLPPDARSNLHAPLRRLINQLRGLPEIKDAEEDTDSLFVSGECNEISHIQIECSSCGRRPITTTWYRCKPCENPKFDLCADCYTSNKNKHDSTHIFKKMQSSEPENSIDNNNTARQSKSDLCLLM